MLYDYGIVMPGGWILGHVILYFNEDPFLDRYVTSHFKRGKNRAIKHAKSYAREVIYIDACGKHGGEAYDAALEAIQRKRLGISDSRTVYC